MLRKRGLACPGLDVKVSVGSGVVRGTEWTSVSCDLKWNTIIGQGLRVECYSVLPCSPLLACCDINSMHPGSVCLCMQKAMVACFLILESPAQSHTLLGCRFLPSDVS